MKDKIKRFFIKSLQFLLNPRFLLCFGIGWIITNGWSYIMLGFGIFTDISWMVAVASTYLAILWLPISPEKIITFAIAIGLMKLLFPRDEKTLGMLKKGYEKAKKLLKKKTQGRITGRRGRRPPRK